MSALESDLTTLLVAYGESAPDDLGLLSRVQARSAARSRRRRVGFALVTAASVAAVAVVAVSLPGGQDRSDRFTDPTGFLVDGRDLAVRLPFTPTYLPGTLKPTPLIVQIGDLVRAQWLIQTDSTVSTQLFISVNEPVQGTQGATFEDVDGVSASVSCQDASNCRVTWQRAPGQLVDVNVSRLDNTARSEALKVARGLSEPDFILRPSIALGLVPAKGCVLNSPVAGLPNVSMNPVDGEGTCPVGAAVQTVGTNGVQDGKGERVRLGGYDGWLVKQPDLLRQPLGYVPMYQAVLKLDGDQRLVVSTPSVNGWNREELDRFVRAIVLHPKAPADPYTDPTGFLVDSRNLVMSFPLTPSYPATTKAPVFLERTADGDRASFSYVLPAGGSAGVTVTVATSLPAALVPGAEKVEGVLAQVTCRSHNECSVLWRRPAGEYVTVLLERTGGRDQPALFQAEALKVARGLQATPLRQPPTVVLGLLPPSCRIARADPETMALIASGPNPLHLCDVSVSLGKSVEPDGYRFKDATLGGRKARIAEGQSGAMRFWLVGIALPDGRTLGVQVPQGNGWNRAELDRFVRAIVLP